MPDTGTRAAPMIRTVLTEEPLESLEVFRQVGTTFGEEQVVRRVDGDDGCQHGGRTVARALFPPVGDRTQSAAQGVVVEPHRARP